MLTPSKTIINRHIATLQGIAEQLVPANEVAKAMLTDALEGKIRDGAQGFVQVELLTLHEAKQILDAAIEKLKQV